MNRIIDIYYCHKQRYGYRRITLELQNQGVTINHKKVKRLMSIMGLYGITPKAKYKSYKRNMDGVVSNHLLRKRIDENDSKTSHERDFQTTSCNEKWSTDVSEFHIASGKLYLSPMEGLILHSDQGWQYQMERYHTILQEKGIIQSMSRKGNCLDNSPMENFFGKMKNEMFYGYEYTFHTLDELEKTMEEYIEYYNKHRITIKLKGLTPVEYRNQSLSR